MKTNNGKVIGKLSPNFGLLSIGGNVVKLDELTKESPVMLVFYPGGPIKPTCAKQLCDYRDNFGQFQKFNIEIVGISSDSIEKQQKFARENEYPFTFLTDPDNRVANLFGVKSFFVTGRNMRAVFIINKEMLILYQYVEPTFLTRRGSPELLGVLQDLKDNNLI